MLRNLPILAIAMTAGLAALVLSGRRPVERIEAQVAIPPGADAWFV